jgi:hypothetical protein
MPRLKMRKSENRQKTKDRSQRTDDRRQRTEVREQRTEERKQRTFEFGRRTRRRPIERDYAAAKDVEVGKRAINSTITIN